MHKHSSAHVYLRLQAGETIDDIPAAVIEDAAQLVKANSIAGNKVNNIEVVYTPWANLKKTAAMEVGEVSFHRDRDVRKIRVEKRLNDTVNRLNKTKIESHPDFQAEREKRDALERDDQKQVLRARRDAEKEAERKRKEDAELRSYSSLMSGDRMRTNQDDGNESDDFMWMTIINAVDWRNGKRTTFSDLMMGECSTYENNMYPPFQIIVLSDAGLIYLMMDWYIYILMMQNC